jgi:hypothetical protein
MRVDMKLSSSSSSKRWFGSVRLNWGGCASNTAVDVNVGAARRHTWNTISPNTSPTTPEAMSTQTYFCRSLTGSIAGVNEPPPP